MHGEGLASASADGSLFRFAVERPAGEPVDGKRRERILRYFTSAAPVVAGYRTDGVWIWTPALEDWVATREVAPEPDFYDRIQHWGFYCPPVTAAQVSAAAAALRSRAGGS